MRANHRGVAAAVWLLATACGAGAQTQQRAMVADSTSPNLPLQKIGAHDLLAISVYDAPEFTRTVRVGADGTIRLPMLKRRVAALGLMPAELEDAVAGALQEERILVGPVVTVTVVEYHSRPISVAGAVNDPITFQALGTITLLEALTRAGGLSTTAGPEILVSRTQPGPDGTPVALTQRVPVRALIDAADPEVNLRLIGGEEIRVPEMGRLFVVGNVKKPGSYPLQDRAQATVLEALALAEGLAPYAAKEAYIIRRDERSGARNELPIPLRRILERKAPDVTLLANDILYVPDNSGRRATMSAIEKITGFGAATASGVLIWRR